MICGLIVLPGVFNGLFKKSFYRRCGSKCLFLCDRYAFGRQSDSRQVTRCVAALMALTTLRVFPVAVVTILAVLASSAEEHEWHFDPGGMSSIHV